MNRVMQDRRHRGTPRYWMLFAPGLCHRLLLVGLLLGVLAAAAVLAGWIAPSAASATPPRTTAATTATASTSAASATSAVSAVTGTQVAATTTTTDKLYLYGAALTQVNKLTGEAAVVQAEIDALDAELERYSEAYNELAVKVDRINVTLTRLRQRLTQAETDYDLHVKQIENRMRGVYKSGGRDGLLPMLFLADGLNDLYNRILLISQLADQDTKMVKNLRESKAILDDLLTDIETQKREQLALRRQMSIQHQKIEARLTQRKAVLAGIDGEITAVLDAERKRQADEQERMRESFLSIYKGSQTYVGPVPQNGDPVLNQVVETAVFYLGVPYVWGGERPSTGMDCSGFTQYVYAQHGIDLPHYSGYQAQMGIPVDPTVGIQTGDLLAFGYPVHHVGIYIGDGMYIHAAGTGSTIKIATLSQRSDLSAIRRFPLQPRLEAPTID